MGVDCCFLHFPNHSFKLISRYQYLLLHFTDFNFHCFKIMQDNTFNSTDSDIFYLEQSSSELSSQRNNTPEILNSTELSGAPAIEHITLSSVASLEPQLITIHSDSNEPTIPYVYGRQDPIFLPSLNDIKLPANPFNILATMEVVHPTAATNDYNYSPQLPKPSEPSFISTPQRNLSTIQGWETAHTTNDETPLIQSRSQGGSIS